MPPRSILHVDMDAFYAAVEQRDDPGLRGLPVVVGGRDRGVVAAASYEARRFGIRSAMPMAEALRRCPDLVRIAPRMHHYQAVSRQVFALFAEITPLVEGLSLDEAFLDVSDSRKLLGTAEAIAQSVKTRILERTGLTASVGVAENKLVAKIASDLEKPDGLVVITAQNCRARLDPLPVSVIPGIGRKTLSRLEARDVRTLRDLRMASDAVLEPVFGRFSTRMRARASGADERPVLAEREEKSISAEETFPVDLRDPRRMQREVLRLTERTARRLQRQALAAGTVHLKIREADFTTCTRQAALRPPGDETVRIYQVAQQLLAAWLAGHSGARVRLLGVGVSGFTHEEQRDLFATDAPRGPRPIDATVNRIRDRFGEGAVSRARSLPDPASRDD
jgi:DNA polymerase IV